MTSTSPAPDVGPDVTRAAELAAREAWGRLVAILASRDRDIARAEDALAGAFVAALEAWPRTGVPANPDAWLLSVARRRDIDEGRRRQVRERSEAHLALLDEDPASSSNVDRRLELLFLCAHPALDEAVRPALMLQTVLRLDAERIAAAFCVAPKTMGQRLWRAKQKIKDAAIPFEIPADEDEMRERLDAVLDGIYAAFGSGWDDVTGGDEKLRGLGEEAIFLARTLVRLLPDEPEPRGLLALMLFASSRSQARRDEVGRFVPLNAQDVARWDLARVDEAERVLLQASRMGRPGPYQLEAAIQSAHVDERRTGRSSPEAVALLYEGLARAAPTVGVLVARAAAVARARGPEHGLRLLEELDARVSERHQPYWVVRAHLGAELGRVDEAVEAWSRALGLTEDQAVRTWILERRAAVLRAPRAGRP